MHAHRNLILTSIFGVVALTCGLVLTGGGCSDDGELDACTPGTKRGCTTLPGGAAGEETCQADKTWGSCIHLGRPDDGGATDGTAGDGAVDAPRADTSPGDGGLSKDRAPGEPGQGTSCGTKICTGLEVCLVKTPIGPAKSFTCTPVIKGCELMNVRTCACLGTALCAKPFDVCTDVGDNTIQCECLTCQ